MLNNQDLCARLAAAEAEIARLQSIIDTTKSFLLKHRPTDAQFDSHLYTRDILYGGLLMCDGVMKAIETAEAKKER